MGYLCGRLLNIIKGPQAAELTNEGYFSSLHALTHDLLACGLPRLLPSVQGNKDGDGVRATYNRMVKRHSLRGEALKRYILKEVLNAGSCRFCALLNDHVFCSFLYWLLQWRRRAR